MDLKHLFDLAVAGAEKSFLDDGEIPQTAIAISGKNELIIVPCPWRNDEDRLGVLNALRAMFKQHSVRYYAFVSEAWMGEYDPDNVVMPSKSERRKEVVIVSATDGTKSIAGIMDILRPFDGPASLTEIKLFSEGYGDGALLSLLNDA